MVQKIQGAQRDFSFGEIDIALKRSDEHPARKAGLRQMSNTRILNSGAVQNRPGRRALYPLGNGSRTDRVLMSAGNKFDLEFSTGGHLTVYNATGAVVFDQAGFPWGFGTTPSVVWAQQQQALSVYIAFPQMQPQVLTWDGASQTSIWTVTPYAEEVTEGGQKRTIFDRISPPNITMQPSGTSGIMNVTFSAPVLVPGMVGTRFTYCGRQITILGIVNSTSATAECNENLLPSEFIPLTGSASGQLNIGDEVIGSISGAKGIVVAIAAGGGTNSITAQLIPPFLGPFSAAENIVGPGGFVTSNGAPTSEAPGAVTIWEDEVMNSFRGFPSSVFADQYRIGFCNFPSVPGGIAWSAIGNPTDLYVEITNSADNAIFEIVPAKAQVLYVVPGPEGSEFIFCDTKLYYIPISPTSPLVPGGVQFTLLSGDGCGPVIPQMAQQAILYASAGLKTMMAVIATGSYTQPFNTKVLSEFHTHLFTGIQAIAAPSADSTFSERYAYVLNGNGSIVVGKYNPESLQTNAPVIGWGPWSGAATVSWIAALSADVIFTSTYFGATVLEILDDTQYLDSAFPVNSPPAAFSIAQPAGKGPLWFWANQSATLMDQVTRAMGTYQIDANGFIVPQNNGGENLAIASLVAGQPWTATVEPFVPDANPGTDVGQRMFKRRVARFAAYVEKSTGFLMARLFSGPITPTSQAKSIPLGTIMNTYRVPTWNQGDNPTLPPPLRETTERWRPLGRSFDPRVAIIKDTPGPLLIAELGMEATV